MEWVYRLTGTLACLPANDLPESALVTEPHCVAADTYGRDYVFLASTDGGKSWQEYGTVIEDPDDWFEPVTNPS